jgi:hypothetical protein
LWLLAAQGLVGAFDTLYYHEYRARLVALPAARGELVLHATRDFIYAIIFATLPYFQWRGWLALVLGAMIAAEIVITMTDFVIEDAARRGIGGVYPGERVSHTVMAIIYGAALAYWLPEVWRWLDGPSAELRRQDVDVPLWLRGAMGLMAAGVFGSGVRDLLGVARGVSWPWEKR